ncbi:MAG: MFS transporter [Fimbriimonadales bacterium]
MVETRDTQSVDGYETGLAVWRRPRILSLLVIAVCAELGYAVLNISAMPPYLYLELGVSPKFIALIITVFLVSEAVFKQFMGQIGDRNGRRNMLVVAPLISVFTALMSAVTHNAWGFVLLRIADGIGAAMIWPNAFAAVSGAVTKEERAEALSALNMCYWLGIALGPFLDGLVVKLTGMRVASFYLVALLFTAASFVAWRWVPSDARRQSLVTSDGGEEPNRIPRPAELLAIMREVPGHMLLSMITFVGIGFPTTMVKLYAHKALKITDLEFGAIVLPAAIAMALLSMPMGRMVERVGRPASVRIGLLTGAVGLWVIAFTLNKWVLAVVGSLVGLGFILAIPAWLALVSDIDEKRRGSFLGAIQTAQGVGAVVGAPLGGLLFEKVSLNAPFVGTAIALSVASLVSFVVIRSPRSSLRA